MYRNTYVEINLKKLEQNVKNIIKNYNYKYYIGIVKANAYGHGYGIIKTLINSGINYLAVSNLEEALEIRKIDTQIGILCLEPIDKKYLEICSKNNISIVVPTINYYNQIKDIKYKLNIHLKLDTGMKRLGLDKKEDVNYFYKDLKKHKNLYLEGIFTHFATSGEYDKSYDNQVEKFEQLTSDISLNKIKMVHIDKSVTMCRHKKLKYTNGVRLGIIMYGYEVMHEEPKTLKNKLRKIKWDIIRKKQNISSVEPYKKIELEPVFKLVSEVFVVRKVKKNEYIGYGTIYKAPHDMFVAVVDIGYADGISMKRKKSRMEINGKLYNIVGDICMGMTFLEVDENVKEKDKVIVIGDKISVRKVAHDLKTSVYETILMIDSNIERKYI